MAKVRMADIAEAAGVSTVTVHNALKGNKGVSEDVRERILELAQEMGYDKKKKDSLSSRPLRIGVLISEKYLADYVTFYWQMYQELTFAAADKGYMVLVETLYHEAEDGLTLPKVMTEKSVDGLVVMGELHRDYIRLLREKGGIPVVFLDFYNGEIAEDAVIADGFYGTYRLTEYLCKRGFTRLGFVGSIGRTSSILDRYCGFRKALMERDLPIREDWLLEDRDERGYMSVTLPEEMPEAFACNCDLAAVLLIQELAKKGLKVPEDVSVVGFDNYLPSGANDTGVEITSFEVPMRDMVKAVLGKVVKQIKTPGQGKGLEVISGNIVEKKSVR